MTQDIAFYTARHDLRRCKRPSFADAYGRRRMGVSRKSEGKHFSANNLFGRRINRMKRMASQRNNMATQQHINKYCVSELHELHEDCTEKQHGNITTQATNRHNTTTYQQPYMAHAFVPSGRFADRKDNSLTGTRKRIFKSPDRH